MYGDKLIEMKDMENFQKMKLDIAKAGFEASLYTNYVIIKKKKVVSSIYRSNIVQCIISILILGDVLILDGGGVHNVFTLYVGTVIPCT